MNLDIGNDVALNEITKAQFLEIAKTKLSSDRIIVEPFFLQEQTSNKKFRYLPEIGQNGEINEIFFIQRLYLMGAWVGNGTDFVAVPPGADIYLDGQILKYGSEDSTERFVTIENILSTYVEFFDNGIPGGYNNVLQPNRFVAYGWKAYRY